MHGHDTAALATRFRAFGWNAVEVDGHDIEALVAAFAAARAHTGAPTVIVARTIKGKGVSFLEGKDGWHGKPVPKGPELEQALREIAAPEPVGTRGIPTRRITKWETRGWIRWTPSYRKGDSVATREAYGTALARLAQFHPDVVVLDGDVTNSTFAEKFLAAAPERYVECYIAEQNMVGVALGLAAEGKIPFVSSFACFLTRAADFLRMGAYSRPRRLILCGSHAGVSIGQDGPSQMGLEDLALFRSLFDSTVLYPCDAVSTERCVQTAIDAKGIVYIRTTRPKTPVLYDNEELFPRGGSKTLRQSPRDRAAIIAAGITVFEALEAADRLAAYCVQPLDAETIRRAARETGRVVVVEDHNPAGGLGEAVAAAVAGLAPVHHLCVRQMPRSGTPRELMRHQGIDADAIVKAVRSER
jgi:transketolase